jgi:rhomboid protease GluP
MLLGRRVDFERRMRATPPITLALIGVLALVFVLQIGARSLDSRDGIIRAGALWRDGVAHGQLWRLVTPIFLHGGAEHLVSNAVALFILGLVCEHAFGRAQFVILFLVSGLSGSVLSVLLNPGPSVGASGAIFGLQGAAIVLFRRHRDRLLVRDRRIGFVLLVWAAYSIIGGIATPYIDNGAHIGGAIGGALLARRLHPVVLDPMSPAEAERARRWLFILGAVVVLSVIGWLGS